MKKLINAIVQWAYKWARSAGIIVLVMCMVSCGIEEKRIQKHNNEVKVWGAGNLIVKGPISMEEVYQVEIDGCQYLYAKWGNWTWVTHKGNCKAHTADTVYIPVPSESHSQIK